MYQAVQEYIISHCKSSISENVFLCQVYDKKIIICRHLWCDKTGRGLLYGTIHQVLSVSFPTFHQLTHPSDSDFYTGFQLWWISVENISSQAPGFSPGFLVLSVLLNFFIFCVVLCFCLRLVSCFQCLWIIHSSWLLLWFSLTFIY
jgi:hypothetical protein